VRISVPLAGSIKLVRRFRTFRSIDFLTVLLDGWRGRLIRATRTGKNGAVLHPCWLAGLPAELPAWLPEPTVAEFSGQDGPFWLASWDSAGAVL
jgi:hypothetical protein